MTKKQTSLMLLKGKLSGRKYGQLGLVLGTLVVLALSIPAAARAVGSCTGNTSHFGSSSSDSDWCGSALQTSIGGYIDLGNFASYLSDRNDCGAKLSLVSTTDWGSYKEAYRGALGTYLPAGSTTAWTSSSNGGNVNFLDTAGSSSNTSAADAACRTVLPTMILDQGELCIVGGSGTIDNPYVMAENDACGVTFSPDTGASTYCATQGSSGTMQTWNGCDELAFPAQLSYTQGPCLTDARDGKVYQVRKFADGNCWMVENLRYGGTSTATAGDDYCKGKTGAYTKGYTDGTKNELNDVGWYGKVGANATATGAVVSLYGDCRDPAAYGTAPCTNGSTVCGYLYNWQAAMQLASAYYGTNVTYPNGTPTITNHIQGICPVGWHLPSGGTSNTTSEFVKLNMDNGSPATGFWQPGSAWNGLYSGYVRYDGTFNDQGSNGYWWSSSENSSAGGYYLSVYSGSVNPSGYNDKNSGMAVRCVKN